MVRLGMPCEECGTRWCGPGGEVSGEGMMGGRVG